MGSKGNSSRPKCVGKGGLRGANALVQGVLEYMSLRKKIIAEERTELEHEQRERRRRWASLGIETFKAGEQEGGEGAAGVNEEPNSERTVKRWLI